jgi:VIT1/CCC1 family predicted Fe2+/Mn2+ transporter
MEKPDGGTPGSSLRGAVLVIVSYLLGVLVPVLPVLLGARTVWSSRWSPAAW